MKKVVFVLAQGLLVALILIGINQYSKFQEKTREGELKGLVSVYRTAQNSYYQEWRKFSPNLQDVGLDMINTNLRYRIVTKPEDLTPDELKLLEKNLPYIHDHAYKVLFKYDKEKYTTYWSYDHTGNLTKIDEVLYK